MARLQCFPNAHALMTELWGWGRIRLTRGKLHAAWQWCATGLVDSTSLPAKHTFHRASLGLQAGKIAIVLRTLHETKPPGVMVIL